MTVPGILATGDVRHDAGGRAASAAGQETTSVSFVRHHPETV